MKQKCKETLEMAVMMLDGQTLDAGKRTEIEEHLNDCGPCFERLGLEREVKTLISRLHGSSPCPDHLRSKVHSIIEEEGTTIL